MFDFVKGIGRSELVSANIADNGGSKKPPATHIYTVAPSNLGRRFLPTQDGLVLA
jgi:hypothetical protein